ncbi:cupin domain-containing protein [Thiotrichales bacterium 19X7-9]|nr:cupin domain-containing protein [Thiotrichales bacterium 19X7-9]
MPVEAIELAKRYQLMETLVAKIEKPINEHLQKRLQKSEQPHINHGNELHIFLAGEGYFIFNLNNKKYRLDISAGDMLYIDGNTEHSFFLTENKHLMLASFHQDEFEVFHKRVEYK